MESRGAEIEVDFSRIEGRLRPLHGGNNGPLNYGELVDLTSYHRELGMPLIRVHDSAWPYPDIVDIHALFPNPDADPSKPENYRFGPTDDYLRAITNTGARIVFRLGESIEHAKRKRYVHPPRDPEQWAAVCVGVVRHYQEGWADGHRWEIPYWEIWNEPENQPAMWTGTNEAYYRLYAATAKALRQRWPNLKIGGPSLGYQGTYQNGQLTPSPFLRGFLDMLRQSKVPLDFFSWHTYTNDPAELARRAIAVRAMLNGEGLSATESHLNEWNYLPGNDWTPMTAAQGAAREAWYARQGGMEGAVFLVSALIELQSAPLDAACFYSADSQPFGLFSLHGTPKKTFHAMKAFRTLLDTPLRIAITTPVPSGVRIAAGVSPDLTQGSILLADSAEGRTPFRIRYRNTSRPSAKLVSTVVINETGQGTIASESPTVKDLDGVLTIDPHGPVVLFLQFQLSR